MKKLLIPCLIVLLFSTYAGAEDQASPAAAVRSVTLEYVNTTGSLGVAFNTVEQSISHLFGMQDAKGMWVSCTTEGEAADLAGVMPGDVVVALDGQVIAHVDDLPRFVNAVPIGATATLTVVRNYGLTARLQEALARNDASAQYILGMMLAKRLCRYDEEHAPNESAVMPLFIAAAEKGFLQAQIELAWMYRNGIVASEDPAQAVYWFRQAGKQGNADAQLYVALAYHLAQGVTRDMDLAVTWYRLSAEQNNPQAQTMLGILYQSGIGVETSLHEAASWYARAAEQGYGEAIRRLQALAQNRAQ